MPKREHLVLGCGHSLSEMCGFSHRAALFETIDENPLRKPDVVLDLRNAKEFAAHYQGRKFAAIIMEALPLKVLDLRYLKDYLQENGSLIYVPAAPLKLICDGNEGGKLFVFASDHGADDEAVIFPRQGSLALDQVTIDYLKPVLTNVAIKQFEITITPDLKARAELLYNLHIDLAREASYFPATFMMSALLAKPNPEPITAGQIQKMAESYHPGWLRRHTMGKTQGMRELGNFLSQFKEDDVLQEQDLAKLIQLAQERQGRVNNSLNPLRNSRGETTRIYQDMIVAILNFWVTNVINLQSSPE